MTIFPLLKAHFLSLQLLPFTDFYTLSNVHSLRLWKCFGMSIILFLAPTGWGKTQKIIEWHQQRQMPIVYLSPLRALCEEFRHRVKDEKNVFSMDETFDFEKIVENKRSFLLISTFEKLGLQKLEFLISTNALFILDEFHLIYLWGQTFRPLLFEMWMSLISANADVIAMTATLSKELRQQVQLDLHRNDEDIYLFDQGVNLLKQNPHQQFIYPARKWLQAELISALKKSHRTILLFVPYRSEVHGWLKWAERNGISAIGCVGGEANRFSSLVHEAKWKLIVATSVISHGVNLPSVESIFISYEINDFEFWNQMVGRGGRRGDNFNLHHMNIQNLSKKQRVKHWSWLYLKYIKNRCFQSVSTML